MKLRFLDAKYALVLCEGLIFGVLNVIAGAECNRCDTKSGHWIVGWRSLKVLGAIAK